MGQSDAELELTIKDLELTIKALKSTNEGLQETNEGLQEANEDLKETIKDLKETIKDLKETMAELERDSLTRDRKEDSDSADLSEQIEQLETEACMMERDRDDVSEKLTECQRICERLQQEYNYLHNKDNAALQDEIEKQKLTIAKLQSQIVDCRSQTDNIHAKMEAAEVENASQRFAAKAAFDKLTADYNTLKVDCNKGTKEQEDGVLDWHAFRRSVKGQGFSTAQISVEYATQKIGGKGPQNKTNPTKIM